MKTRIIITALFITAMAGASVIPLQYHFTDKTVPPLPEHRTYPEALSQVLPEAVKQKAAVFKCKNFIRPVKSVDGSFDGLPNLVDDTNFALQAFSGWRLCVDEALKKKMIERADQRLKHWGAMGGVGQEMMTLLKAQKNVAMKTHYSAQVKCAAIKNAVGNDTRIVLSVNDERQQVALFEIPVTFIKPARLAALKADKKAGEAKIAELKKKTTISLYSLAGVSTAFFVWLVVIGGIGLGRKKNTKAFKDFIAGEIDKREELINDGHFVAALELADKYLDQFPHDTEIKAFRLRLLDYTNNDPEKAQLAFVEYKKLQSRMNNPVEQANGALLSQSEKQTISKLLPYHPELKSSYNQLVMADQRAEQAISDKAEVMYNDVLALLKAGDIAGAGESLTAVTDIKPDFKKAVELKYRLGKNTGKGIRLIRKEGGETPEAEFFFNAAVSFGREDVDNLPEILFDDRRVSRKHLTIDYENGGYQVTDLESAGGTFVNGDAVKTTALAQGDLLTISKVIDFSVITIRNGGGVAGMLLNGKDRNLFFVKERVDFDLSGGRVKMPGTDVSLIFCDGVAVLSTDKETIVPENGDEITTGNDVYTVEVVN